MDIIFVFSTSDNPIVEIFSKKEFLENLGSRESISSSTVDEVGVVKIFENAFKLSEYVFASRNTYKKLHRIDF